MVQNSSSSIEDYILYDHQNTSVIFERLQDYMMSPNISLDILEEVHIKLQAILSSQEGQDFINEDTTDLFRTHKLQRNLKLYLSPILLVIGLIGNTLSFVFLRYDKEKKMSINAYLSALALADIMVLISGLLSLWVQEVTGVDFFRSVDISCKVWNVIAFTSSIFSVWLIVAITAERFIVVCFPLAAHRICNKNRAIGIIVFLLVFSVCFNAHFLVTTGIVNIGSSRLCDALDGYKTFIRKVWTWVDATMYCFFPLFIISALNTVIISKVITATKKRRNLQHLKRSTSVGLKQRQRRDIKLNVMLLTVSITFCISSTPMVILMVTEVLFQKNASPRKSAALLLARTICELLMYVNHSINFFLYCISGQSFTKIFMKLISCRGRYHSLSQYSFRRRSNVIITSKDTGF
ncbi:growth hormone secretagogue receptor type 1-like [Crassostrea angulata]|uniref:growth hormone secretagogue receptor type 1-like n=1 Tax=Magallana angulata TaxID=2784310 RepID=UPI0022B1DE3A|nr:growth hormone secretagogue receptor type 1-like [Crassostrea angulata]